MAAGAKREIKTTLKLDGEKAFKDAIADSRQELKVMGSELKELSSEYKLNGDQMDYLSKKSDVLKREIAEQEKIVAQTAAMYEKAADGGEEFVGKARQLNIQLNNSRTALNRMKSELQSTDRELEELGRDAVSTGRDIDRGLTDAAQNASREVRDMVTDFDASLGSIDGFFGGGGKAFGVVAGVAAAGIGAAMALNDWANESYDYTLSVGRLRTNAELQAADWDFIEGEFLRVAAITGDADTAVEGISAILNTGINDAKTLTTIVNMLAGATIKYSDLDFGGLATDLQETVAQREVVGSMADVISRMGYDIEDVNRELGKAETDTAALSIMMGYFAEGGLAKVYDKYMELNGEVVGAKTAQLELNDEWQRLGTNAGIWLQPAITAMADLLGMINQIDLSAVGAWIKTAADEIVGSLFKTEEEKAKSANKLLRTILEDESLIAAYNAFYGAVDPYTSAPHLTPTGVSNMAHLSSRFFGWEGNWVGKDDVGQTVVGEYAETIPAIVEDTTENVLDLLEGLEVDAYALGKSTGEEYATGLRISMEDAVSMLSGKISQIGRMLDSLSGGSAGGHGGNKPSVYSDGAGASVPVMETNVTINMELDGHRLGAALVPHLDGAYGKYLTRTHIT